MSEDEIVADASDTEANDVKDVLRNSKRARGIILIDDEENIAQAITNGVTITALYRTESLIDHPAPADLPADTPSYVMADAVAKEIFGKERHSRMFALAHRPEPVRLRDLTDRPGDILVLDGVRLAGNIGAVTRSACAFGAAGIVLLDSGLKSVMDRRLIRASRGYLFDVPLILASPHGLLRYLEEADIPMMSLQLGATATLDDMADQPGRIAMLLGGEKGGSSTELEDAATWQVSIDMLDTVESLNVSVAAALALYTRRRHNMR